MIPSLPVTQRLAPYLAIFLAFACTPQELRRAGDRMLRVERGAQGLVTEVERFKTQKIDECRAQDLATAEDRAACVAPATELVESTEVSVRALRASLVTFWELYPLLEARTLDGGRLSPEDLAMVLERAGRVAQEYLRLAESVREAQEVDEP